MSNNRLWVLGASDPEMVAIEQLLLDAEERVAYAIGNDGERVHPGNAYRAIGFGFSDGQFQDAVSAGEVYLVECQIDRRGFGDGATLITLDHHRPGDPGYGRGPEEFLSASSLGQVFALLLQSRADGEDSPLYSGPGCVYYHQGWWGDTPYGVVPVPSDVVLAAAADHCLESAYRGKCPGVEPDALMRWRAESRAAHQGRTVEAIMADIEAARARLRGAVTRIEYEHPMGGGVVEHYLPELPYADLRGEHIPELPEAAAREGIAYLATVRDRDGREKVVLGAAAPDLVRRFMAGEIVPGLTGVYGDPARGFAGGYLAPQG